MAIVGDAIVIVRTSTAGLEKELAAQVKTATEKAGALTTLKPKVDAKAAKKELSALESAVSHTFGSIKEHAQELGKETGIVGKELGGLSKAVSGIGGGGAAAAGTLIGIGAALAVVAEGVGAFTALTNSIYKFQLASGASAEDASKLVALFNKVGIESSTAARGFFLLSKNLNKNSDELKSHGIEIVKDAKGNTDLVGTFLNLADAVNRTHDPVARADLIQRSFGRSGKELLPVLSRNREELEKLINSTPKELIFKQEQIDKGREFAIQTRELNETFEALKVSIGQDVVPALISITPALGHVIEGYTQFEFSNDSLVGKILRTSNVIGLVVDAFQLFGSHGKSAADEVADAIAKDVTGAQDLSLATNTLADAQIAARNADLGVTSAKIGLAQAEANYAALIKKGKVDREAVAAATDRLASSNHSLEESVRRVQQAQQDFDDVLAHSDDIIEESAIKAGRATNARIRAEKAYADAKRHHSRDTTALSDAQYDYEQAVIDETTANEENQRVQAGGIAATDEYKTAKKEQEDAAYQYSQAVRDEAKAEDDLRKARAGDPDFALKLAAAVAQENQAVSGVNAAYQQQLEAHEKLSIAQADFDTALDTNAGSVETFLGQIGLLNLNLEATARDLALLASYGIIPAPTTLAALPYAPTPVAAPNTTFVPPGQPGSYPLPKSHRRAAGGPVQGGQWYQVNEDGQEFFRPDSNGTIIPVGGRGPRGGSAGGGHTVNNYITESHSPSTTAQLVSIYTGRALRTASR